MHVARYGLVIVLLWFGGMKFTACEGEGILAAGVVDPADELGLPSHGGEGVLLPSRGQSKSLSGC